MASCAETFEAEVMYLFTFTHKIVAFQLTLKILRMEIVNYEAFHFLMRLCYRQSEVFFWGKSAHNIVTKSVMTTVGYTKNVSVDASARCSSECIC